MGYQISPEGIQMLLIILGALLFIHTLRVANECPKRMPNLFVIIVSGCLSCGVGIVYEALHGELVRSMAFAVASCALQLASSVWLWGHGVRPHEGPDGEFSPPSVEAYEKMRARLTDIILQQNASGTDDTVSDHWWNQVDYGANGSDSLKHKRKPH